MPSLSVFHPSKFCDYRSKGDLLFSVTKLLRLPFVSSYKSCCTMSLSRARYFFRKSKSINSNIQSTNVMSKRNGVTTPSGALLPEPQRTPFGLLGLVCAVVPGLLVGAMISKNVANFLEENELFVPSDDDDDDD